MSAVPKEQLLFNEETHQYFLGTRELPSVTTVMKGLITNFDGIPKNTLEHARQRGTAVHKACEYDDLGILDESTLSDELVPYLEAWRKFKTDYGFIPMHIEKTVFSSTRHYAGTVDRVGQLNGSPGLSVIDMKARAVMTPDTGPQTAAYKKALSEEGIEIKHRYGIQLLKDGNFTITPYTDYSDISIFYSCLQLYNWKKTHGIK